MAATGKGSKAPKPSSPAAGASNYDTVNHWFDLAADRLELRDDIREVMRSSYREVRVQIPVKLADGEIHVFSGFRVQHNGARGPYKGGMRYHLQLGLVALRGVDVDADLGAAERDADDHALVHRQDREGAGPDARHPGPRRGHQRLHDGLDDGRVRQLHGHTPATVTGKPIALEGSYGREAATGRGLVNLFREAAPGLELVALATFVSEGGTLPEFDGDGVEVITPDELLGLECEVNERLGTIIRRAYREIASRAEEEDTTLRLAAFETGIERVVEAATPRGYIS